VTYPDAGVIEAITDTFVPCGIDIKNADNKPVIERFRQAWTPDFRVLGPDGFEYAHFNGFLPPDDFIAQALVAAGQTRFRMGKYDRAAKLFDRALRDHPQSRIAPEAAYWAAVSRYKVTKNRDDLHRGWRVIQERYPDSPARHWQSYIEDPA